MWSSGSVCLVTDPASRSGLHQPEDHAGDHPGSGGGHGLQVSQRRCGGGGTQAHRHKRLICAELFCQQWWLADQLSNRVIVWFLFQCYFHVRAVRSDSPPQRSRQWEGWVWCPLLCPLRVFHTITNPSAVSFLSLHSHFFSPALSVVASLHPVCSTSLGCPSSLPLSPSVLLSVLSGRPSQTFALPLGLCLCLGLYLLLFNDYSLISSIFIYRILYYVAYILCVL